MIPSKRNLNTDVHNEQKEKPQTLTPEQQLELLRNITPDIDTIGHFYKTCLRRPIKRNVQFFQLFNLLDEKQKKKTICSVKTCLEALQIPYLTKGYDQKHIRSLISTFLQLRSLLEFQLKESKKKINQQPKQRRKKIIQLLKNLVLSALLIPQYKVFEVDWTISIGFILGMAIFLILLSVAQFISQCVFQSKKKQQELTEQKQEKRKQETLKEPKESAENIAASRIGGIEDNI